MLQKCQKNRKFTGDMNLRTEPAHPILSMFPSRPLGQQPHLQLSHCLASLSSVLNPAILSSPPNLVANALASILAEHIIVDRAVRTKSRALVEEIALLNRLALFHNGLWLRRRLALRRAGVHRIPDPALAAAPANLVTYAHLARAGVAELVAVDVADRTEDGALVELVTLLDLRHRGDNWLGLALGGARVHGVAHPAVVAEGVAH